MGLEQDWMKDELGERALAGTRRALRRFSEKIEVNLSSNDYLGLRADPRLVQAASRVLNASGLGSGASRLVTGNYREHEELESDLAEFFRASALLFSSGYLANLGLLSAVADRRSVIFMDKLAHASLIDGALLSRAKLIRFKHNDAANLEQLLKKNSPAARKFVVTESIFSMDGDIAPLADIIACSERYSAGVIVDEAHAVGAYGPLGRGVAEEQGVADKLFARTGTLSKAFGTCGGFVVGSAVLCDYLINSARSFIYDTSLPPAIAEASRTALRVVASEQDLVVRLKRKAEFFRDALRQEGLSLGVSESHVVPIIIGESAQAVEAAEKLQDKGVLAVAIREPTVPKGSARLRFSVSLAHSDEQLARAAKLVGKIVSELGSLKL